jgi:hypothetical protein
MEEQKVTTRVDSQSQREVRLGLVEAHRVGGQRQASPAADRGSNPHYPADKLSLLARPQTLSGGQSDAGLHSNQGYMKAGVLQHRLRILHRKPKVVDNKQAALMARQTVDHLQACRYPASHTTGYFYSRLTGCRPETQQLGRDAVRPGVRKFEPIVPYSYTGNVKGSGSGRGRGRGRGSTFYPTSTAATRENYHVEKSGLATYYGRGPGNAYDAYGQSNPYLVYNLRPYTGGLKEQLPELGLGLGLGVNLGLNPALVPGVPIKRAGPPQTAQGNKRGSENVKLERLMRLSTPQTTSERRPDSRYNCATLCAGLNNGRERSPDYRVPIVAMRFSEHAQKQPLLPDCWK